MMKLCFQKGLIYICIMQTEITLLRNNMHRSGSNTCEVDFSGEDAEIFKYCSKDKILGYIYILWGRCPPAFCTRISPEECQREYGVELFDVERKAEEHKKNCDGGE